MEVTNVSTDNVLAQSLTIISLDLIFLTERKLKDIKLLMHSHSIYIRQNRDNEHITRRKFTLFKHRFNQTGKNMKINLRHPRSSELSPQSSEPSHCHFDGIHRWLSHLNCVELQLKPSNVRQVQI